jgi:predicted RNase H-like nuclease (RuvC/YqgF family)
LDKPYGSDSLIDTDIAGYEYDSENGIDEQADLEEHINVLARMLETSAKESSRLQHKVEQLEYEMRGWKELYRRDVAGYYKVGS